MDWPFPTWAYIKINNKNTFEPNVENEVRIRLTIFENGLYIRINFNFNQK